MEKETLETPTPETPQTPVESVKTVKSFSLPLVALVVMVTLVVGGGLGYYFGSKTNVQAPASPADMQEKQPTPTTDSTKQPEEIPIENTKPKESSIEDTTIAGQKRFASPKLGISFLFMSDINGETINVKEVGNKVYVYSDIGSGKYENGQYLEVFQKDEKVTLANALRTTFLRNYTNDCVVTENILSTGNQRDYPSNYKLASIKVKGEVEGLEDMMTKLEKCPSPYTQSNGISYFLMDENHPDKFLFFSIGQYAIDGYPTGTPWQDTIEFLD